MAIWHAIRVRGMVIGMLITVIIARLIRFTHARIEIIVLILLNQVMFLRLHELAVRHRVVAIRFQKQFARIERAC